MTPNLLDELEGVVRLMEAATPGKWSVVPEGKNEFGQSEFKIEVFDGTCPIVGTGSFYGDPHDANACVAAVNFLRTRHAAIKRDAEDARRYRHIAAEHGAAWEEELDAAIAATQEGEADGH